ncbi:MAG TPA: pilus assembly protein TadG-related protein [Vicinamibacterales bacterium]|nr:pilus assembly protein TadG-related protein [Vicinamibacterales bacterium]
MMRGRRSLAGDDRGAVLVHVALAMLTLIAFSAFAIDYGALLGGRRQAQNAADAAALAGALSLAYDDPNDIPRAQAAAVAAGLANPVLGAAPSIDPATDVNLIPCPPGAPGLPDTCIRADVYRSAARSNALPTFFATMLGVTSQNVRATATAQVATGSAVECLKPFAMGDKWQENWEAGKPSTAPWTPTSTFDKYMKQGGQWVPDPSVTTPDVYVAPSATDPGTGFTPFDAAGDRTSEYGLELTLKVGSAQDTLSAGWFQALDLPLPDGTSGSGAADYRNFIGNCTTRVFQIGDTVPVETGNMVGPTGQGIGDLVAKDPGATWNPSTQSVDGSCAPGICPDGQYHARSPRIVAIPLFSMDAFFAGSPNGKTTVTITNIMGFFVEGMGGSGNKDVLGRLVSIPGVTLGGGVDETASFLRTVLLVR